MEDDSETETDTYHEIYGVQLLDDIHNYLPALLYDTDRFNTIGDVLQYLGARAYHYNDSVYTQHLEEARRERQRDDFRRNRGRAVAYPSNESFFTPGGIMNSFLSRPPLYHTPVGTHFSIVDTLMQFAGSRQRRAQTSTTTTAANAIYMNAPNPTVPLNFFDPVPIVPTRAQIAAASTIGTIGTDIGLSANLVDNLCSICQDNYTTGDVVRTINHCGHMFHRTCIDQWFLSNVHCPLCRHDIRISGAPSAVSSETPSGAPSEMPSAVSSETNAQPAPTPTIRTPLMRTRDWGELLDSPINPLDETQEMNITANLLQSTIGLLDASGGFGFYSESVGLDDDIYGMNILQTLQGTADISGVQALAQAQAQAPVYTTNMFMIDEFMYDTDADDSYSDGVDSLP
jgi:hypothetical protein